MATAALLDYYRRRASEYEAIYRKPERQSNLARLRALLRELLAGRAVLEVACGTGYWTAAIADATAAVLATDAADETLALARGKSYPPGRVRFAVADAYDLAAIPGAFTALFAGFWLSHVPLARVDAFLRAVGQRLGPGGLVVLCDNRYVEGSSTPPARRDADGNTYQLRALADGSECEVLKNFPTADALRSLAAEHGTDVQYAELAYFWLLAYRLPRSEAR